MLHLEEIWIKHISSKLPSFCFFFCVWLLFACNSEYGKRS